MENKLNVQRLYAALARIVAAREGCRVSVSVQPANAAQERRSA